MLHRESTEARGPDDIAAPHLSPDECYEWGEEGEYYIQSNRPRATAIDHFAREEGVRFQDVRCTRRYMRLLTRRQSWAHNAEDYARDRWVDNHDPPLTLNRDLKWVAPDGTICEPPRDMPMPDDWQPDEGDPVWEWCDKGDPGAIPCWYLEVR